MLGGGHPGHLRRRRRCRCSARSPRCPPGRAPSWWRSPAPPATPGTCLTWSRPDAADTAVVDCAQPHLFEQAGAVRADRPGGAARRPAVAAAGQRAVQPGRRWTTWTAGSTRSAATGWARSSRRRRSGPRATASCAAACRARRAPARCTRSVGQGRRVRPVGGAGARHLPGHRRPHDRRPGGLRRPARRRDGRHRRPVRHVPGRRSRRSATRTRSCSRSARGSPPSTPAAPR